VSFDCEGAGSYRRAKHMDFRICDICDIMWDFYSQKNAVKNAMQQCRIPIIARMTYVATCISQVVVLVYRIVLLRVKFDVKEVKSRKILKI
jgi:hypothetical protein